jgi:hypothetical protein
VYQYSASGDFQVPQFKCDAEHGWYMSGCLTGAFVIATYRFDASTGYRHSLQVRDTFPEDLPALGPYDTVRIQGPVDAQAALALYNTIPSAACEAALPPVDAKATLEPQLAPTLACKAPAAAAAPINEGPLCPPAPDTPLASEAFIRPLAPEVLLAAEPRLSASLAPAAPLTAAVEPSAPWLLRPALPPCALWRPASPWPTVSPRPTWALSRPHS